MAWLKQHAAQNPFRITGVGGDHIEGVYLSPVKDPAAVAKEMYEFCPDIVDRHTGTVEQLAAELRKGRLYFWWD